MLNPEENLTVKDGWAYVTWNSCDKLGRLTTETKLKESIPSSPDGHHETHPLRFPFLVLVVFLSLVPTLSPRYASYGGN